ncbi:MAG: hypothetical protein JWN96_689 [Mycobacterium sp.]|jgi:hypothetical protein|nr:hypothetical protein [Mycobacterium sp.]
MNPQIPPCQDPATPRLGREARLIEFPSSRLGCGVLFGDAS